MKVRNAADVLTVFFGGVFVNGERFLSTCGHP